MSAERDSRASQLSRSFPLVTWLPSSLSLSSSPSPLRAPLAYDSTTARSSANARALGSVQTMSSFNDLPPLPPLPSNTVQQQQQQHHLPYPSVLLTHSTTQPQPASYSATAPPLVDPYSIAAVYQSSPGAPLGTPQHPLIPKRRRRTSPQELAILEVAFQANPLPTQPQRAQLASRVGMTGRAVQVWFQNRR